VEEEGDDLMRPAQGGGGAFDQLDDPLPSYAHELDEPLAQPRAQPRTQPRAQPRAQPAPPPPPAEPVTDREDLPRYELDEAGRTASVPAMQQADAAGEVASAEVEAALEEADFYAQQGVFETARETIEEALRASPSNAL